MAVRGRASCVRRAHTLPATAGSTRCFPLARADANLNTGARHMCLPWVWCVNRHGTELWPIKAVSENIRNTETHQRCWRKIEGNAAQRSAECGWLTTRMFGAADQEIKHRAVRHNHGRWGKMSQSQSSGYQKPSLPFLNPVVSSACRTPPSLFQSVVEFVRNPLKQDPLFHSLLPDDKDVFGQCALRNTKGKRCDGNSTSK